MRRRSRRGQPGPVTAEATSGNAAPAWVFALVAPNLRSADRLRR